LLLLYDQTKPSGVKDMLVCIVQLLS